MKNSLTESQKGLTKEQQLRALREARFKKSDGGGENRRPAKTGNMPGSVPGEELSSSATSFERTTVTRASLVSRAGVATGPSEPIHKRGRPPAGETRDKPWIAAGMSKATYYRRQAEERSK
jgi:hypothetical protein